MLPRCMFHRNIESSSEYTGIYNFKCNPEISLRVHHTFAIRGGSHYIMLYTHYIRGYIFVGLTLDFVQHVRILYTIPSTIHSTVQ